MMSSERAGVYTEPNLDDAVIAALRESARVHTAERIPHMAAPLLALADALERRAGVYTGGALNREKAEALLQEHNTDPQYRADLLDALEACVVPDPRTITCARCGRTMLAAVDGNPPDNDAMEVCGLCWVDLSRDQAMKLARLEAAIGAREHAYYAADEKDWTGRRTGPSTEFTAFELRAILRGDQ